MQFYHIALILSAGFIFAQKLPKKKIVCYYVSIDQKTNSSYRLTPEDVDLNLCTHISYVFFMPDVREGLLPRKFIKALNDGMQRFLVLRKKRPDLQILASVGGWEEGTKTFSRIVSDPDKRAWFILYATATLRLWESEGADLNWQWPALREGSSAADKDNYAKFIKGLKENFIQEAAETGRPVLKLSVMVPSEIQYIERGFDLEILKKYADFLVIYSMDYHLPTEPSVNYPAPLYVDPIAEPLNSGLDVDTTVRYYLEQGVPPEKLLLGIPTYGRSFTLDKPADNKPGSPAEDEGQAGFATNNPGTLAHYEICTYIKRDGWTVRHTNDSAVGPYAFKGPRWVAYDDENMVRKKAEYARKRGLGGLSFWTLDMDDFRGMCQDKYPLVRAGRDVFMEGGDVPKVEEEYLISNNLVGGEEQEESFRPLKLPSKPISKPREPTRTSNPDTSTPAGRLNNEEQAPARASFSSPDADPAPDSDPPPEEAVPLFSDRRRTSTTESTRQGAHYINSSRDILFSKTRLYLSSNHYDNIDYKTLWG